MVHNLEKRNMFYNIFDSSIRCMVVCLRKINRFHRTQVSIVYEWVKRESGENPERSRHCVRESVLIITEKSGRE